MNRHKKANPFHTREDLLVDHVFQGTILISHRCPVASDFYEDLLRDFRRISYGVQQAFLGKIRASLILSSILPHKGRHSLAQENHSNQRWFRRPHRQSACKGRMRPHGLDESKNRILLKGISLGRKCHKSDVTQTVLGMVRNAD